MTFIVILFLSQTGNAQSNIIFHGLDKDTALIQVNTGDKYYDSGGPGGSRLPDQPGNYKNCGDPFNESTNCTSMYTLCAQGGDTVTVNFTEYLIVTGDRLRIFSGTKVTSTTLYNSQTQGVSINGMRLTTGTLIKSKSTDGCLTFEWFCTTIGNSIGWDADIIVRKKIITGPSNCMPVCRDLVKIILPPDTCYSTTLVDQYLSLISPSCNYSVKLFYPLNTDQLSSLSVNNTHIGKTFLFQALDSSSSTSCTGYVSVQESPTSKLICSNDTIDCTTWANNLATLTKVVTCTGTTFNIIKSTFIPLDCSSNFIGKVIRQVQRIESNGIRSDCQDTFYIRKLNFASLTCPTDLHLSCSILSPGIMAKDLTPEFLSSRFDINNDNILDGTTAEILWPLINQHRIGDTSGLCLTSSTYTDLIIPGCGSATKIRRQWMIKNACSGKDSICVQYIIIEDQNSPVLPEIKSLEYQLSGPSCKLEVNLDAFQGIKDCSPVTQRIELSYPDPITPGKMIIINNLLPVKLSLPPGGYTLKYTFSDQCFNSARREVCLVITESTVPSIKPIPNVITYLNSNECKSTLVANSLNHFVSGTCCDKFHVAIAFSDSIDFYKNKWLSLLKSQCQQTDSFAVHASFYNQFIEDWITSYLFKDSLDVTGCQDARLVLRAYDICNLPPKDSVFTCGTHQWFCYNTISEFRSWFNVQSPTSNNCPLPFKVTCFSEHEKAINPFNARYNFSTNKHLNDSVSCMNIYLKRALESSIFSYSQVQFNAQALDTHQVASSALPDLTMYVDGDQWSTDPPSNCCTDSLCIGEAFNQNTWPGNIKSLKDSSISLGYYGGPVHTGAVYDVQNYYEYPMCNEYNMSNFLRPIYCQTAIRHSTTADSIDYNSIFYRPVFNSIPKSKEFNIASACSESWSAKNRDSVIISDCAQRTIVRYWTLISSCGKTRSLVQKLIIKRPSDFQVTFPQDIRLNCDQTGLDTSSLNKYIGLPEVHADQNSVIQISFVDSIGSGIGCKTIIRTWNVRNQCFNHGILSNHPKDIIVNDSLVADPVSRYCVYRSLKDGGDGIMQYKQVIQFNDMHPPIIFGKDTTLFTKENCSTGSFSLRPSILDDCSPRSGILKYANLDINSNGIVDKTFIFDSTLVVQDGLPIGRHGLKITAIDLCGNRDSFSFSVIVVHTDIPQVFCIQGVNQIEIPSSGAVTIQARDFDAGSYTDCNSEALKFSFSNDFRDSVRTLTCDSLGSKVFSLWVSNIAGNQSTCMFNLQVNAGFNACVSGIGLKIEGLIQTTQNVGISGVVIKTNLLSTTTGTNATGFYSLNNLSKGKDIKIRPEKTEDAVNGLSTIDLLLIEKHIKGQAIITDPYLLIAADVNKSGSITATDLIEIRKLILGSITSFANVKSWQFIPKSFQFDDPANPWTFPEMIEFNPLNGTVSNADFVGIKMGDINHSAVLGARGQLEERSQEDKISLYVKSDPSDHVFSLYTDQDIRDVQGLQLELILPVGVTINSAKKDQIQITESMQYQHAHRMRIVWTSLDQVNLFKNRPLISFISADPNVIKKEELVFTKCSSFIIHSDLTTIALTARLPFKENNVQLSVFPNPSQDRIIAKFFVNDPSNFRIYLTNLFGQVIPFMKFTYHTGLNHILLTKSDLGGAGKYYIVTKEKDRVQKRLIIVF